MVFYTGTHVLKHAKYLTNSFISVNRLKGRKSDFNANNWILDSGAFTELERFGEFRTSVIEYADLVNRWCNCGVMELAVTQDYMCEPFMLQKTGLKVKDHQELTIERYDKLITLTNVTILPVLQGYKPEEYERHVYMYGSRLKQGMRVGVGSVCKRNTNVNAIVDVLTAIKNVRTDLRLHGFGLKTTALYNAKVVSLLYSADSMAWSYAARRQGGNANGLQEALDFTNKINKNYGRKPYQETLINC